MNNLFVEFSPSLTFGWLTPRGCSFNNIDSAPLLCASSDKVGKQSEHTQYQNHGYQGCCVFHTMIFFRCSVTPKTVYPSNLLGFKRAAGVGFGNYSGKIRWKFRNTAECLVKKGKEIQRNKVVAAQTLDDESVHGHRGGASEGSGCPTPDSFRLFATTAAGT